MAARLFKDPVSPEKRSVLGEIAALTTVPMCPGCPSCNQWAKSTDYAFQDISRYVTYYEQDGNCEARDYYRELPSHARHAQGIDLARLRDECQYHVDYPEIARRSELYFA